MKKTKCQLPKTKLLGKVLQEYKAFKEKVERIRVEAKKESSKEELPSPSKPKILEEV